MHPFVRYDTVLKVKVSSQMLPGLPWVIKLRRGPHGRILRPLLFSLVINQITVAVLFVFLIGRRHGPPLKR